MSDDSKNFRRAKPVFMGLRRKLNGDIQNLIKDNEKKFAKQAERHSLHLSFNDTICIEISQESEITPENLLQNTVTLLVSLNC